MIAPCAREGNRMANPQVAVVIAARNSARTIGWAIGSALRQPEVAEVLVMDDASDDDTASAAEDAEDDFVEGRARPKQIPALDRPATDLHQGTVFRDEAHTSGHLPL